MDLRKKVTNLFRGKTRFSIVLRVISLFLGALAALFFLLIVLVWMGLFGKIPTREDLKNIERAAATEVYSADSVLLGRYFFQDRSPVNKEDLPDNLVKTLIATEDVRFYKHSGVDYRSLGRVLIKSILLQNESAGGGSTLTQQLAKNLYPRRSYGFLTLPVNKIKELLTARRLEKVYTKEEILLLYLNTIPFADNTYGIKTAAERFYSTPVKQLTWDQSAMLVGMLKATHTYNPRLFPERALGRRNVVLNQLSKYKFIDDKAYQKLKAKPLGLRISNVSGHANGIAPYFRAYIKRDLLKWCRENKKPDGAFYDLYKDGLRVYTTIDSRLQRYAEQAVRTQMKALQTRFAQQLDKRELNKLAMAVLRELPQYHTLKNEGLSDKNIVAALKKPVRTKVFTYDGAKERFLSIYDSIIHHIQFLQTGFIAMDPQTGDIKAWVGGINHEYFPFDHARETTKRQVGSTIKPIMYAAAMENGISPCTYISARKTEYSNMESWTPENTSEDTYDKKYSMEGGLAGSVNTVSVKLLEKTGIRNAIHLARRMGINSDLKAVPSLALGTPSISVLEMVKAYAAFANQGVAVTPAYITSITDRRGKTLAEFEKPEKQKRALSRETASMMVHMLRSVVNSGTGAALRTRYGIRNDVAGKTGTTQSNVDGWFMAITPRLVMGTWVGADNPRIHFKSTSLGQGAATALPIAARFLQLVNQDKSLSRISSARFAPLPPSLQEELDCEPAKSNLNLIERIFKKKKKTKVTKFRGARRGEPS